MNEINISFKELIDYLRDKDFQIEKLTFNLNEAKHELQQLRKEQYLVSNWLNDHGINLAIERNKVIQLEKEGKNNE